MTNKQTDANMIDIFSSMLRFALIVTLPTVKGPEQGTRELKYELGLELGYPENNPI